MKTLLILLLAMPLFSGVYKAKVQPYESVTLSAEVSGRIVQLDQKDELKMSDKTVLVIDHALESKELENTKAKLKLLNSQIAIKLGQYNRIKNLQGQSQTTKERYRSELLTYQIQAMDLKNAIARLEDVIVKKEIVLDGKYLKALHVKEGAFVAPGTRLMDIEDQSGSRIVIFVDGKDRQNIETKTILINGKIEHGYQVEKAGDSTDAQYLSSYRVELVKEGKAHFGEIVTVEIGEK